MSVSPRRPRPNLNAQRRHPNQTFPLSSPMGIGDLQGLASMNDRSARASTLLPMLIALHPFPFHCALEGPIVPLVIPPCLLQPCRAPPSLHVPQMVFHVCLCYSWCALTGSIVPRLVTMCPYYSHGILVNLVVLYPVPRCPCRSFSVLVDPVVSLPVL